MTQRFQAAPNRAAWSIVALMLATCCALAWREAFTVDPARAVLPAIGLLVIAAAAVVGHRRRMPRLTAAATAFGQMTLFTLAGVVLAYALAARGGALWDDRLGAADRALGFDWPVLLTMLDAVPPAAVVLGLAYHSLVVQMIVAIVALSEARRFDTLRTTVLAAVLSGFVTILISGAVPAMGNLFDPARFHHLWPSIAWLERGLIGGLRDGSHRVLDLTALMGIVSFPSFHATLAAIFIWAFRDLPRLARPMAVLAGLTIVATPVFGGHYAVDVLAGLLLAPPALAAASLRWPAKRQQSVRPEAVLSSAS